jgi:hypothetical protein
MKSRGDEVMSPEPEDIPGDYDQLAVSEWGLDWGDISQIRSRLALTPTERLRAAQEFINAVIRIRAQNDHRAPIRRSP